MNNVESLDQSELVEAIYFIDANKTYLSVFTVYNSRSTNDHTAMLRAYTYSRPTHIMNCYL